ncbi:MAG: FecR domain-containing protein [Gallionella sp.]
MIPQERFKLSRQAILLATISAAFPVTGYCIAAGRVEFAIGNVESVTADGIRHVLGKGAEINAGESISTADGARAQIRFTDGGFVSLQPSTLFRVDEYNYQNKTDGNEKGFFSLFKGGFRAVTGFIGHLHKSAYRVRTPEATLGIRGTGYNMALRDDGLFVNVGEGAISLDNNAGYLVVTAGGAAFVANFNTAPQLTTQLPLVPPNGLPAPVFIAADQRNSVNTPVILPGLASGPGYAIAYASTGTITGSTPNAVLTGITATFSGTSQLAQYSGLDVQGAPVSGSPGTATSSSTTDGTIGWGRWVGTTAGTGSGPNPLTGVFDYVVGIPTAAMPTSGTATYSLLGYTSPTATDGTTGYTVNGTLTASFVIANPQVVVNMNIANSASSYAINNATLPISGATFGGIANYTSNLTNCSSGCATTINGFFAGTNASRAGLSYSITAPTTGIQGVAAFAKN